MVQLNQTRLKDSIFLKFFYRQINHFCTINDSWWRNLQKIMKFRKKKYLSLRSHFYLILNFSLSILIEWRRLFLSVLNLQNGIHWNKAISSAIFSLLIYYIKWMYTFSLSLYRQAELATRYTNTHTYMHENASNQIAIWMCLMRNVSVTRTLRRIQPHAHTRTHSALQLNMYVYKPVFRVLVFIAKSKQERNQTRM